jgi:hypothetical protein
MNGLNGLNEANERYWLQTSFWYEPSEKWKGYIREVFEGCKINDILSICSNQFQHTSMRDYTNKELDSSGKPVKFYIEDDYRLCPSFFQDVGTWLDTGRGAIKNYNRVPAPGEPDKRGIYKGHLYTHEKVPAQCMVICQFVAGVLKTLGVPARLRIGFIRAGDNLEYAHHNELEYYTDGRWTLVDPTTLPQHGIKWGDTALGGFMVMNEIPSLVHPDFMHVFEAVGLARNNQAFAENLLSGASERGGYRILVSALVGELFALRNEGITSWKVQHKLYKGKPVNEYEDQKKLAEDLSKDLERILALDPQLDDIRNVDREVIDYRLREDFKRILDDNKIKYPRTV